MRVGRKLGFSRKTIVGIRSKLYKTLHYSIERMACA